jgi:hypothetical protein
MNILLAIIARAEAGQATIKDGYALLEIMQREADRLGDMIAQIESGTFPRYTHKIIEPEDRNGT